MAGYEHAPAAEHAFWSTLVRHALTRVQKRETDGRG